MLETQTQMVHFSITGEFTTKFFRDLVLEHRWNQALQWLVQDLVGMTYDTAISILSGENKLTGENTLDLVPEDPEVREAYREELRWHYGGIYRLGSNYYKPYAYVTDYGPEDLPRLRESYAMSSTEWGSRRTLHYADNKTDIAVVPKIAIMKKIEECNPLTVLMKEVTFPPFWVDTYLSADDAISEYLDIGRHLDARGHHVWYRESSIIDPEDIKTSQDFQEPEEDKKERIEKEKKKIEAEEKRRAEEAVAYIMTLKKIGQKVRDIADSHVYGKYGFFDLHLPDGRKYKIPYPPFENWALKSTSGYHLAIPWETISPSGMKMQNDDPYHTDWVLGAEPFISLDSFYGIDKDTVLEDAVLEKSFEIQDKKLGFEIHVFSGEGIVTGKVVHPEPGETVEKNSIVVIPSLNASYLNAMLSVQEEGCIISESGGEGSHLVMVGKKKKVKIAVIKDARKLYPVGSNVFVNFTKGKLQLLLGGI